MLDTNTFDFIIINNLISELNRLTHKRVISIIVTQVQMDEIGKMPVQKKELIEKISMDRIPTSVGWTGEDVPTKRGYSLPKSDWFKAVDDDDTKILNKLTKGRTKTHPSGNTGDVAIVYTAIKENIDYLVSSDKGIKTIYNVLKSKFNSNLKLLDHSKFQNFLESRPY